MNRHRIRRVHVETGLHITQLCDINDAVICSVIVNPRTKKWEILPVPGTGVFMLPLVEELDTFG